MLLCVRRHLVEIFSEQLLKVCISFFGVATRCMSRWRVSASENIVADLFALFFRVRQRGSWIQTSSAPRLSRRSMFLRRIPTMTGKYGQTFFKFEYREHKCFANIQWYNGICISQDANSEFGNLNFRFKIHNLQDSRQDFPFWAKVPFLTQENWSFQKLGSMLSVHSAGMLQR